MPSLQHRAIDRILRLTRFRHWYWRRIDGSSKPRRVYPKLGTRLGQPKGRGEFEGFPYIWFGSKHGEADSPVIALHGGGYVVEASVAHLSAFATIAEQTGKRVYVPYYPLAPFHTPKAIQDWTVAFAGKVAADHGGTKPLLMGDSAGGNLALQLTSSGIEAERILLWSPWLDIGGTNPEILARDGSCALLRADGMQEFVKNYHGDTDPRDPMISPIYREAEELPPTLILSGGDDLLHPDIENYATRRAAQGQPVELHTEPGVWHDYMLFPTPEARRALDRSVAFLLASSSTPASPLR